MTPVTLQAIYIANIQSAPPQGHGVNRSLLVVDSDWKNKILLTSFKTRVPISFRINHFLQA